MIALLLATWACSSGAPEAPAPEPTPVEAAPVLEAPPVAPEPTGEILYEVVVLHPGDLVTGTRVWSDGSVQLAGGSPGDVTWSRYRTVGDTVLDEVEAVLASDAVAKLPSVFPDPTGMGDGPQGTYRVRQGATLRVIEAEAYGNVRVPPFERIEDALRRGSKRSDVRTRWTLEDGRVWALPCDVADDAAFRGLVSALMDPDLPAARDERLGTPVLRIDWMTDRRAWHATLYADGRVSRTNAQGKTEAFRNRVAVVPRVRESLARLDEAAGIDVCARK